MTTHLLTNEQPYKISNTRWRWLTERLSGLLCASPQVYLFEVRNDLGVPEVWFKANDEEMPSVCIEQFSGELSLECSTMLPGEDETLRRALLLTLRSMSKEDRAHTFLRSETPNDALWQKLTAELPFNIRIEPL